ncbi:MAG TPA: hypothetical protein VFI11_04935 [Anaerolineales bacterium]|nr:hypothetical protein [Anaerolineales bacterium]
MPHFLLVHEVLSMPTTQTDWIKDWSGLRKRAQGEAKWTASWYSAGTNHLYCEWEAPDVGAIQGCFTADELRAAPIISADEVARMDPAWLD